jgi:hypothetical protein
LNYKNKTENSPSEGKASASIGKKYFDLSLYKAQTSEREIKRNEKTNLRLPQLKSTFETDLYSETASKRKADFPSSSANLGN